MISFAESVRCRHAQVAAHFGESLDPPCGSCDVCAQPTEAFSVPADIVSPLPDDVGEAIAHAVSTTPVAARQAQPRRHAARLRLRAADRAGLTLVRDPRRGERARRSPLDRPARASRSARREDHARGVSGTRSRSRETASPDRRPRVIRGRTIELFERLRSWRADRARADSVPAYVVFPDATLRDVAALRPSSLGELATVKGVGPAKLDRYGDDVLSVVGVA